MTSKQKLISSVNISNEYVEFLVDKLSHEFVL